MMSSKNSLRHLWLTTLLTIAFVMATAGSVLAEASFDAKANRIEYKGKTTIEDIFQGVADPKIISRKMLPIKLRGRTISKPRYSYTIHRDIFGHKGSTLSAKNLRLVFAGDRNITSEGRVEINNVEAIPLKSGQQWHIEVVNPKGKRWHFPPERGLLINGLKARGGRVAASISVYHDVKVKSPVRVVNSSFSDFVFRRADLRKQISLIFSKSKATVENVTFRNVHLEKGTPRTVYTVYQGLIQLSTGSVIRNIKVYDFSHTLARTSAVAAILSNSAHKLTVENAYIEVDAGCGLHQHATTTASHYKNITLVGKKVPTGGNPNAGVTTQISVGYSRYGHRGKKSGVNIDKLENITISTFRMGVRANTSCGLEMNEFKISKCDRAVETGFFWILNQSEISHGDRIDPRTFRNGTMTDVQYGYWLHGTVKKGSKKRGFPVPTEWGNVRVFSENVKITAAKAAIMTDRHGGHEFSALNDTYKGEIRIRKHNPEFHLNLVNTRFDKARTFVESKGSYVKDFRLLTVKVLDAKGKPVPGAKVTIKSNDGGEVANARGEKQGDFLTGKNGSTAIAASDAEKCPAILAWRKTPEGERKGFTYTVRVGKGKRTATLPGLPPGKIIDYRKAGNMLVLRLP